MAVYKNYDLNAAGDPPPWGGKEEQAFKDIIDTLVSDAIGNTKDTSGHKHTKVYNGYSTIVFDANNTGNDITIGGDPDTNYGHSFVINMRNSYIIEGNASPAEHTELFRIDYGSGAPSDMITMGGDGTQRLDINLRDLYADAFRLRVGTADAINVSTASGNRQTQIGSPGVTYPVTMTNTGDVYTRGWTEITTSCTYNGFLDLDPVNNKVWMRQIGGLVFVQFTVQGTSDNPFTSIQFPFSMEGVYKSGSFFGFDSSGNFNVVGSHTSGSATLSTENYLGNTTFWQSSGTKGLSGSFVTSVTNPQFTI